MRLIAQIKNKPDSINLYKDIIAGIIVALVSIPISMGYASIAGLPVIYGLYGSFLPILVFSFLTTSPQFVVGVDAMPAVMVGSILTVLGIEGETAEALEVVPVISFLVMVWFFVFYIIKAGRIVKYISKPVMGGFITGVGLTIILMQIPKLFGGTTGTGEINRLIYHIYEEWDQFNMLSFILGISTVIIILAFKKLLPKVPMTVIMLVAGAFMQIQFKLDNYGVKLLPDVSNNSFSFIVPNVKIVLTQPSLFLLESFSIAAVIMAQTLLATGNYAYKYGYKVDNGKELLAYGCMNGASMILGCLPINGSVSRSGIADSYGTKSQIMSISAAISMLLVILFGTQYLKYLPVPILTGIVMTALIGILEGPLFVRLFRTSKRECLIFIMSLCGVLLLGTVNGVIIGLLLSFADVALQATVPPTAFMGRIPGKGNFYALDRNTTARPVKNAVIYRFSGNLIFANIDKFQADIESAVGEDTKCVIIDARSISVVDVTSVDRLVMISNNLEAKGIRFYITEHSGQLNDLIRKLGGEILVESGKVRRTISLALRDAGIEKPYELEEDYIIDNIDEEKDEMFAEFEWAFGEEAQERLEKLASNAANEIADIISTDEAGDINIFGDRLETSWGKLGRFDESEFWDFLEFRLEELAREGRLSVKELVRIEKLIEERRIKGEKKLKVISPGALKILNRHRQRIRERLKLSNEEEYAHMKELQQQYYEHLKQTDPELAEQLKELHEAKNSK